MIFALLHLTVSGRQFGTLVLFGLVLGYAAVATGSLWTAFAIHYAWNFTNLLLAAPPVHGYFAEAYRTPLFRCGASWAMVALTLVGFATIFAFVRRRFSG
jgi:membrane protease YdiL (CAAX protease family)